MLSFSSIFAEPAAGKLNSTDMSVSIPGTHGSRGPRGGATGPTGEPEIRLAEAPKGRYIGGQRDVVHAPGVNPRPLDHLDQIQWPMAILGAGCWRPYPTLAGQMVLIRFPTAGDLAGLT